MQINKNYISNQNSYPENNPEYIVIHNTDNFDEGADAKAHARAQHDGNLSGMSAHYYVDDSGVYQAMPHSRGAWHVGVNYGGKLFGTVNNRNSIGVEMCVNAGYNYEKAFQNTVTLTKQLMQELGIDTDHVVSHYDVCAKNCPSQIREKGDWARFKKLIGASGENICGIAISDSNVEAISKVVYGEAGVIRSYNALLGVAQCIYDMRQSGRYSLCQRYDGNRGSYRGDAAQFRSIRQQRDHGRGKAGCVRCILQRRASLSGCTDFAVPQLHEIL